MKLIGSNEVPCIDDTDYAAYALYMQCVAQRVESQLVDNLAAEEETLHRPARQWFVTDVQSSGSGGTTGSGDGVTYTYNFPALFANTDLTTLNRQGWWRIGFNSRATSSAPVLNNWRIVDLAVFAPTVPSAQRNVTSGAWIIKLEDIVWESNTTGGEVLYASADVYNPGDPNADENAAGLRMIYGIQTESNGVENVTFDTQIWAIFLGNTPSINITS